MTHAALAFFILTLLVVIVGAHGIVGLPINVVKNISLVLLAMGVFSYIGSVAASRKNQIH